MRGAVAVQGHRLVAVMGAGVVFLNRQQKGAVSRPPLFVAHRSSGLPIC